MHHHNERTFDPAKAARLDDPGRREWLPPDQILAALELRPGLAVADIGAGTGYFAIPMSRAVGGTGRVFAVDLQGEMLEMLRVRIEQAGVDNVVPLPGSAQQTSLPGTSCDLVFFANVWHELDDLPAVLQEALRVLKPGGRLAILDWRHEAPPPPGPPSGHRVALHEVEKTLENHGWLVRSAAPAGRYSYLLIAEPPPHPGR